MCCIRTYINTTYTNVPLQSTYVRTWYWFEHIGYECVHDALIKEMVTHSYVGNELLALAQCHQLRQWEGLHIFILAVTTESRNIVYSFCEQQALHLHHTTYGGTLTELGW